jgi:hypothetical protein
MSERNHRAWVCWMVLAMLSFPALGIAADDPAPADADTAAALKILGRRVGTWDEVITIKPGKFVPPGATIKMVTVVKWTNGGRFIQGDAEGVREQEGQKQKTGSTWIQTYNKQKRHFNSWFFFFVSGPNNVDYWGGSPAMATNEWDERSQTMRFEAHDEERGITGSGSWHWIDDDHFEFGIVTKDKEGNIVMEQTGKGTRRKEK